MRKMQMFCHKPLNLDVREKIIYIGPKEGGGINLGLVFDGVEAGCGWQNGEVSEIKDYLEAFSRRGYILAFYDSPNLPSWRQRDYNRLKVEFLKKA
jgi:hypothetical protein